LLVALFSTNDLVKTSFVIFTYLRISSLALALASSLGFTYCLAFCNCAWGTYLKEIDSLLICFYYGAFIVFLVSTPELNVL
jgi:hypothetical protein